ncbi:hypothetical protein I4A95_004282 [Enterobacter hormaechei]|uniref:Uncharacterized protein n=1 Tax=Citrobacter amalonaticus TaxID=35703 RepID=A0A9C7QSV5_CITAM|nr:MULTISPECIES: hypothetical protein [Citrobacter]EDI2763645.1 hypothetical protein [Salmonella enterica subsp. enterica serovar Schwarzengrund]EHN8769604.1 hypothetical protein [Enterobacter hormaechei]HAK4264465.1 hypothetical protein [Salmonella enterica]HCD1258220.1 hypothetical protein [Citrobacter amalonaticus]EHN8781729.1 hypothetical protein [Enterobacter hormaechei]
MENKDQRLEIRIPQQQLAEVDAIIDSIDPRFKPSRSDVVRSFIAQGIDRHYGRGGQVQDTLPLGQRISLFFQICQQQQMQYALESKRPPVLGQRRGHDSNITPEALVRQVYLQRMFWFFELDRSSLAAIDGVLTCDEVLSLMEPEPGREVCAEVNGVAQLLAMFSQIEAVRQQAEQDSGYTDIQEKITLIRHYASRCRIPLHFDGYPETWVRHNQIASLMQWIEEGKAGNYLCSGYGSRIFTRHSENADAGRQYAQMLQVHQDITGEGGKLDLDGLIVMVQDRRLDFSTPA